MSRFLDVLRLSIPLMASQCTQSVMLLTDTVLFGLQGLEALAGGGLAATLFQFFFIVLSGLFMTVAFEAAIQVGRGQTEALARLIRASLLIALGVSAGLGVLLWWMAGVLGQWVAEEPLVIEAAATYLRASAAILLPSLLFLVIRGLASGYGMTGPILPVSLIMAVVNLPLSWALMDGIGPLPALGLSGIAWGTSLTLTLGTLLLLARVIQHPELKTLLWHCISARDLKPDFRPFWRLGTPIAISHGMEAGVFTAATLMAASLGAVALATHNIALQTATLSFNLYIGIAQGHAIRVGQSFGAGKFRESRAFALTGSMMGVIAAVVAIACFLMFPEQLIRLFTLGESQLNPEIIQAGVGILVIAAAFQAVDGAQVIAMAALRAIQEGLVPTLITVVGYWVVAFPLAYLLMPVWGLKGIWIGLGIGLGVTALALLARFHWRLHRELT